MVGYDNSVVALYDYDVYGAQIRFEGTETIAYQYTGQARPPKRSVGGSLTKTLDCITSEQGSLTVI